MTSDFPPGERRPRQVALVTGAASGIGAATARRLVADGSQVVLADVQADLLNALAVDLGDAAATAVVDVSDESAVSAAVDLAIDRFGRLDLAFANAGVFGAYGPIATADMSAVDRTWEIDLRGVFLCMKHAARVMVDQRSGVIIATTSPAAVTGGVGNHAYSAAKAGVLGLMRSVAAELRPHGIRVNAVMPGPVVSAMTADLMVRDATAIDRVSEILTSSSPAGRPGLPEDIAAAVAYLSSEQASFITGHCLVVDGGFTSIGAESPFTNGRNAAGGAIFEGGRRVSNA